MIMSARMPYDVRSEDARSNAFLAVKGCLGVFFMVFEVGLKLLVLLKGACFVVVVRLHICDANWSKVNISTFATFNTCSLEGLLRF